MFHKLSLSLNPAHFRRDILKTITGIKLNYNTFYAFWETKESTNQQFICFLTFLKNSHFQHVSGIFMYVSLELLKQALDTSISELPAKLYQHVWLINPGKKVSFQLFSDGSVQSSSLHLNHPEATQGRLSCTAGYFMLSALFGSLPSIHTSQHVFFTELHNKFSA